MYVKTKEDGVYRVPKAAPPTKASSKVAAPVPVRATSEYGKCLLFKSASPLPAD